MESHVLADCWPPMDADRFAELVADIREHGLRVAITLYEDKVLDGRNRLAACQKAKVVPHFETFEGTYEEAFALVFSGNAMRRDMTTGGRAAAVLKMSTLVATFREEAAKRRGKRTDLTSPPIGGDVEGGEMLDILARRTGISGTTMERVARVQREDPALFERIATEEITPGGAEIILRRRDVQAKIVPLPKGKFNLIYADPPWQYHSENQLKLLTHTPESHYPTMPTTEICALEVPAADNCALFLWATVVKLPEALEVMRAWGFRYVTQMVWDKQRVMDLGVWFLGQHELLLLGIKGQVSPPPHECIVPSIISEKRRGHSQKPERAYEIIEAYFPNAKRLEMFARGERKGWTSWGADAGA